MEHPVQATDFGKKTLDGCLEFTRKEQVVQRVTKTFVAEVAEKRGRDGKEKLLVFDTVTPSKDSFPHSCRSIVPTPGQCTTSCF